MKWTWKEWTVFGLGMVLAVGVVLMLEVDCYEYAMHDGFKTMRVWELMVNILKGVGYEEVRLSL